MPDLLARYQTFVYLPSAIEPFCRVAVEAWAAGCDVLVNSLVGARYYQTRRRSGSWTRPPRTSGSSSYEPPPGHRRRRVRRLRARARLVREGHEVTVLDRISRGKQRRLPTGAFALKGDVRDPHVFDMFAPPDMIWHLAYVQGTQTFYADPKDVIDVALKGIMNVLGVCERLPDQARPVPRVLVRDVPDPARRDVPHRRDGPSVGAGRDEPALLLRRRQDRVSEIATLAYAQAGLLKPGGDRPAPQHLRPGHGERARDPGVRDPDDGASRRRRPGSRSKGPGRETRSLLSHRRLRGRASWCCIERGEDRNVYHLGNPAEEYAIEDLALEVADWFGRGDTDRAGRPPEGLPDPAAAGHPEAGGPGLPGRRCRWWRGWRRRWSGTANGQGGGGERPPGHRCGLCGSHNLRSVLDLAPAPRRAGWRTSTSPGWRDELSARASVLPGLRAGAAVGGGGTPAGVPAALSVLVGQQPGAARELRGARRQVTARLGGFVREDLVVDIGANDGTLLSKFEGCRKVGVEPTHQAEAHQGGRGVPGVLRRAASQADSWRIMARRRSSRPATCSPTSRTSTT